MPWKLAAALLALLYFGFSAEAAQRSTRWEYERTRNVRKLVLGVAAGARTASRQRSSCWMAWTTSFSGRAFSDHPFGLVGANYVYLTPGTEKEIVAHPGFGDRGGVPDPAGPDVARPDA